MYTIIGLTKKYIFKYKGHGEQRQLPKFKRSSMKYLNNRGYPKE